MSQPSDWKPEFPPNWIDYPDYGMRADAGGDNDPLRDSELVREGDVLRWRVRSRHSLFVAIFGSCFLVWALTVIWLFLHDEPDRNVYLAIFGFIGTVVICLIHTLFRYHETRGDYITVDRANGVVQLPRHSQTVSLQDVCCLQLLRGRTWDDRSEVGTDLNLMVQEGDQHRRYHLVWHPEEHRALKVAEALGVPLIHQECPPGWYRSSDSRSKEREARALRRTAKRG